MFSTPHKSPKVGTPIPGPKSAALYEEEKDLIGPGLQAVVQWAKLSFTRGEGPFLIDRDENRILDFMGGSGVNSIGHSHPKYLEAVTKQMQALMIGAFSSESRVEMLKLFRKMMPSSLDRVQLYTGGTEAVEAALRLAKSHTKKYEFLSFWNGYHGKSLGALALTDGAKKHLGPMAPGALAAPYADCYRCPFKLEYPSCGFACVEHVREVIQHESTGALSAIVVEPIQGRLGNIVPPPGYLAALQTVAKEFEALLIVDETMTCLGRTGKMLASEHDDVVPDIVIMGKGLAAGYPSTAIAASSELMRATPFSDMSASSSSFGGFPAGAEAVRATLEIVHEEKLADRAAKLGTELLEMLEVTCREVPIVGRVCGRGLMLGIELVEDKQTKKPVSREVLREVFQKLLEAGVLVMLGRNSFRLYPALNIDPETAKNGIRIIDKVLRDFSAKIGKATSR